MSSPRTVVAERHGVTLDRFQVEAMDILDAGGSVLVAAPTSAGKTLVAEHGIELALSAGRRAFYTAPIKALSNQKWRDLGRWLGRDRVGLLTGDNVVNPDADVVVMTTEVLRNMLWAGSDATDDLGVVVLDEMHYLMDDHRGPVWEEVIINLPAPVRLVCLSATVSNATEVAAWLAEVRGEAEAVIEHERPVPLHDELMVVDRATSRLRRFDVTDEHGRPNQAVLRLLKAPDQERSRDRGRPRRTRSRVAAPRRVEVVEALRASRHLPVIHFIFSRRGCDDAARACREVGLRLTSPEEERRIDEIAARHVDGLTADELGALGHAGWLDGLRWGVAAHHAGMVPPFKEAVEECFAAGLLKVVFATETLAMGVNLPARTVVLESLSRFRGEGHEPLRPADYAQLTGRAGRRGIDDEGRAVTLWSRWLRYEHLVELATSRDFELRSAFRPTWNMAANLVATHDRDGAHALLGQSFAQYRADRRLVARRRRLVERRAELSATEQGLRADGLEPDGLLEALRAERTAGAPQGRARGHLEGSLARLRPGDVIDDGDGRPVVVLSRAHRGGGLRLRAVSRRGRVRTLSAVDFTGPVQARARVPLPEPYTPTQKRFQKQAAALLRDLGLDADGEGVDGDEGLLGDGRVRARAVDLLRQRREVERLETLLGPSGADLVRQFEELVGELEARGYVRDWDLTDDGRRLARIFHESDLLVAEALGTGVFDGLDPAGLAALVSTIVHEHRGADTPPRPWFPPGPVAERFRALTRAAEGIARFERVHRLPETRPPDAGIVAAVHGWTLGLELSDVLAEIDLGGGDFVRRIRSVIDLLGQIAAVAPAEVAATARTAAGRLDRGLVAAANRLEPDHGDEAGGDATAGVREAGFREAEGDDPAGDDPAGGEAGGDDPAGGEARALRPRPGVSVGKGLPWGRRSPLPPGAPVLADDAALGEVVTAARARGRGAAGGWARGRRPVPDAGGALRSGPACTATGPSPSPSTWGG